MSRRLKNASQSGELKRFDEEVDGAPLHRFDGLFDAAEAGDDDNRKLRVAPDRFFEHFQAACIWKKQVHHHCVVSEGFEPLDGIGGIDRLSGHEPGCFERLGDGLTQGVVVFDNQDGGTRCR